ncbi:MAG: hypothetical protein NXH91_01425 [Phyllobacteriaceae bacterium]|jgi:hypothetical protein|nr:hypothetical protein [Phyllobacteriaceae bacterium]
MIKLSLTCAAVLGALMTAMPQASAHEPYYPLRESAECADPGMIKKIKVRFAHQARHVHHRDDLAIADITGIHQHRYLPQDVHDARPIPRRYCHATAHLSDGRERKIWYLIEGGAGFASIGSNVEFCVSGFDRWNVYNSACRVLR